MAYLTESPPETTEPEQTRIAKMSSRGPKALRPKESSTQGAHALISDTTEQSPTSDAPTESSTSAPEGSASPAYSDVPNDEKVRRELRVRVRATVKDMATTIQNLTGAPHEEALAYVVAEAQWVQAFYLQQQATTSEAGTDVEV